MSAGISVYVDRQNIHHSTNVIDTAQESLAAVFITS